MRIIILITLLALFLSACGQSKFDQSMRNGKDAIQSGNYEEAVKQFNISLIEKPTDKDAQILSDRSNQELDKKRSKQILAKYQEDNSKIYADYMQLYLKINLVHDNGKLISLKEIEISNAIDDIYKRAIDIGRNYKKYTEITKAHDDFINALGSYRNAFEEVKKNGSQFRVNQYMKLYQDYLQSYKDKIAAMREN
jgi:tetratricopeptide (TPR) repeat protein